MGKVRDEAREAGNLPHQIVGRSTRVRRGRMGGISGYRTGTSGFTATVSEGISAAWREEQAREAAERVPFLNWNRGIPEPKTGRLNFERFPYLFELYAETAALREVVVKKASQVGVSAWLWRWAVYWADLRAATALYVFPKQKQMWDFSDARVRDAIRKSKYLRSRVSRDSVDNKGHKEVGLGRVQFRGSESTDDLESVDADVLVLDEYNRLVPANIPVAEKRIAGPMSMGLMRRVGNPTYPNYGITVLYEQSDKRRWFVKCNRGHEQYLTWDQNVDTERAIRVCRECGDELTSDHIAAGRWVAEHPDRDVRGYHMPRLIVPNLDVPDLVRTSQKTDPRSIESFVNRDLAEEHSPREGRLDSDAIARAVSLGVDEGVHLEDGYVGLNLVTMGVDQHIVRPHNVRISEHLPDGRKRVLWAGLVPDFNELGNLMERYRVQMCCIDHLPDGRTARGFANRYPGRVYLAHYAERQNDVIAANHEDLSVSVRTVEAFDTMMEQIRRGRNLLAEELPPDYARHLQAPMRVVEDKMGKTPSGEKAPTGQQAVKYLFTGASDYAHAEVYDTLAAKVHQLREGVERAAIGEWEPLEDRVEFERSALSRDVDDEYSEIDWSE